MMQESLSKLYDKVSLPSGKKHDSEEVSLESAHHDAEFRRKKQDVSIILPINTSCFVCPCGLNLTHVMLSH